jgi:hypothetical protein
VKIFVNIAMIGRLERRCHLKFKKYALPVHKNSAGNLNVPYQLKAMLWIRIGIIFRIPFQVDFLSTLFNTASSAASDSTVSPGSPDPDRI